MIDDKLLMTVTPRCFELSTTSNSCPFIRWAETPVGFWQMRFFVPCTCFTLLSENRCAMICQLLCFTILPLKKTSEVDVSSTHFCSCVFKVSLRFKSQDKEKPRPSFAHQGTREGTDPHSSVKKSTIQLIILVGKSSVQSLFRRILWSIKSNPLRIYLPRTVSLALTFQKNESN